MTWPEVIDTFIQVCGVLGMVFLIACMANGWPGQKGDD